MSVRSGYAERLCGCCMPAAVAGNTRRRYSLTVPRDVADGGGDEEKELLVAKYRGCFFYPLAILLCSWPKKSCSFVASISCSLLFTFFFVMAEVLVQSLINF